MAHFLYQGHTYSNQASSPDSVTACEVMEVNYIQTVTAIYREVVPLTCGDNAPPKSHRLSNKTSILSMRNLFSSCWLGEFKKPPKQYRLLMLPLIASQNLKVSPYRRLEDTTHFGHTTGGTDLELTWSPPCCKLTLIVLKGAVKGAKRKIQSIILTSYGAYE